MDKNFFLQHLRGFALFSLPGLLLACAPIVDGDMVGRRIQREFTQKTNIAVSLVECPQDQESKAGQQFTCTIYDRDKRQLPVPVTLRDDPADFTWSVPEGLINLAVIEENIEQTFRAQRLSKVTASCGDEVGNRFKIARAGDKFPCQVQEANDEKDTVEVEVKDEGKVDFQVLN